MVWTAQKRVARTARGGELHIEAELRNRGSSDARGVNVRAVASSHLDVTIEPRTMDLPAGSKVRVDVTVRAKRVGRWGLHGMALEVRGTPAGGEGLYEVPLMFANPYGVEVLPMALHAMIVSPRGGRSRRAAEAGRTAALAGEGDQLRELREHVPGDAFKRIAWKASARRRKLIVREMEREERDVVWLVLDASCELWAGPPGRAPLDYGVDEIAALAAKHLGRGDHVGLVVTASRLRTWIPPGSGGAHAMRLAAALASAASMVDADRCELDEHEVAQRVAEHARPREARGRTDLAKGDLDQLATRAGVLRTRAPFAPRLPVRADRPRAAAAPLPGRLRRRAPAAERGGTGAERRVDRGGAREAREGQVAPEPHLRVGAGPREGDADRARGDPAEGASRRGALDGPPIRRERDHARGWARAHHGRGGGGHRGARAGRGGAAARGAGAAEARGAHPPAKAVPRQAPGGSGVRAGAGDRALGGSGTGSGAGVRSGSGPHVGTGTGAGIGARGACLGAGERDGDAGPPDAMIDARALLREARLSPKRSFGQNFLVNERVIRGIAEACVPDAEMGRARVLELGAGLGALTADLLDRAAHVTAVERDRDLVPLLSRALAAGDRGGKLVVLEADAQAVDPAALLGDADPASARVLCGNLPYQITGRLLQLAVVNASHVDRVVFMVQEEVADRLVASPGTKEYGAPHCLRPRRLRRGPRLQGGARFLPPASGDHELDRAPHPDSPCTRGGDPVVPRARPRRLRHATKDAAQRLGRRRPRRRDGARGRRGRRLARRPRRDALRRGLRARRRRARRARGR